MHSNRYTIIFTMLITMVLAFVLSSVYSSLEEQTERNFGLTTMQAVDNVWKQYIRNFVFE